MIQQNTFPILITFKSCLKILPKFPTIVKKFSKNWNCVIFSLIRSHMQWKKFINRKPHTLIKNNLYKNYSQFNCSQLLSENIFQIPNDCQEISKKPIFGQIKSHWQGKNYESKTWNLNTEVSHKIIIFASLKN